MELASLIGRTAPEIIAQLPEFSWRLEDKGRTTRVKIGRFLFVYYQKNKPRSQEDLFRSVDADEISERGLDFIKPEEGRCIGLMSKVQLREPFGYQEGRFAHIPMIDFDTNENFGFMPEDELLRLLKENIKTTEVEAGLFLKSSLGNYHFVGVGRLFSEEEFISFLGLCLTMKHKVDGRDVNLVDSRHVGHSLTPMKYFADIGMNEKGDGSVYDYGERFSTLRLTPRTSEESSPRVVDIYGGVR
jgi:hypothetical protein